MRRTDGRHLGARRCWTASAVARCSATPIAEYVPDRLAHGRVALVGDAAHVPTPMTGSGFSASLDDAEAITEALTAGLRDVPMREALRRYEQARLHSVRGMVQSGQQFSRSFERAA
jgi:2-polyprenyl-6-methoxyphenol hydroxylase-like FAD-dependent oxidoreductase